MSRVLSAPSSTMKKSTPPGVRANSACATESSPPVQVKAVMEEGTWNLSVQILPPTAGYLLQISCNGEPATPIVHQSGSCTIKQLPVIVSLRSRENPQQVLWESVLPPSDEQYLVLELTSDYQAVLRPESLCKGNCLILAPEDSTITQGCPGIHVISREPTAIDGWVAYRAVVPESLARGIAASAGVTRSRFHRTAGNNRLSIRSPRRRVRFRIQGKSEFVLIDGERLQINFNSSNWKTLTLFCLPFGRKGVSEERLIEAPTARTVPEAIADVLQRHGPGYYWLGLSGIPIGSEKEVSPSFRVVYLPCIHGIELDVNSQLACAEWDYPLCLVINHDPCVRVRSSDNYKVVAEKNITKILVRANRRVQKVAITIEDTHSTLLPPVTIHVKVGRFWWALGTEERPTEEWNFRPIKLPIEKLIAGSREGLWIRLPEYERTRIAQLCLETKDGQVICKERVNPREEVFFPFRNLEHLNDPSDPYDDLIYLRVIYRKKWRFPNLRAAIGWVEARYRCKTCTNVFPSREEVVDHIRAAHRDAFFRDSVTIPSRLYVCVQCGKFATESQSELDEHFKNQCRQKRQRIVTDPEEISTLLRTLPGARRQCTLCNKVVKDPDTHLMEHIHTLYEVIGTSGDT
ncbi:MAG: hypothetical protein NZ899_02680 [Thermoguttaceae bacterium]|nr:hypothetical protein [Thermoguttaceae bacterium]